jgi:hypothetical protein
MFNRFPLTIERDYFLFGRFYKLFDIGPHLHVSKEDASANHTEMITLDIFVSWFPGFLVSWSNGSTLGLFAGNLAGISNDRVNYAEKC